MAVEQGQTLEQLQQDGWSVVADPSATFHGTNEKDAQGNAVVLPEIRMPAGVPARGRGTQLDPDQSWRGVALATTPLAHPTGVDAIDNFTSPVGLASLAAGGAGIVRAGIADGAIAAAKATAAFTNPVLKFEVARRTMKAIGVPEWAALPIAYGLSGYTKGAKGAPEGVPPPADLQAPHLDRSVPVPPSALTQEQLAERVLYGRNAPPPAAVKPPLGRVRGVADVLPPDVAPAPPAAAPLDVPARPAASGGPAAAPPSPPGSAGPTNSLPDQRALNEAALAQRRAAYQARVQAAAEADAVAQTPAPARLKLTAPESKEYLRLRQAGMTDPQTMEALQAARDFQARFGTPTPTVAETKFPKQ
jgi:hypothetical protein